MTLEEIFQIEGHAETAFVAILTAAVSNPELCYRSRTIRIQGTPALEVKVLAGEPNRDHEHIFQNEVNSAYDTYVGELQVTIKTNRSTDAQTPSHTQMLGKVRALLNRSKLMQTFESPVLLLIDCWEQGTIDSEEDADNLDLSTLSWFLMLQIKPSVWPANP